MKMLSGAIGLGSGWVISTLGGSWARTNIGWCRPIAHSNTSIKAIGYFPKRFNFIAVLMANIREEIEVIFLWYNQYYVVTVTAGETMKTAISLPDLVFEEAETLASQLGLSRSELYTKALQAYLRRYNRDRILSKLNQVYSEESSELDPVLAKMQFMSLPHEDW